jgi:hypothetical protein
MPKEDYLLKYLEKLSRVIAAMFGFRDRGFPEDSLRLADETYKELLDSDTEELSIMPIEKFVEIIRKENYNASYLEVLAQLANETADSYMSANKIENANSFYAKALQMYYILNEKDKTFSFEREMKITELEQITRSK